MLHANFIATKTDITVQALLPTFWSSIVDCDSCDGSSHSVTSWKLAVGEKVFIYPFEERMKTQQYVLSAVDGYMERAHHWNSSSYWKEIIGHGGRRCTLMDRKLVFNLVAITSSNALAKFSLDFNWS